MTYFRNLRQQRWHRVARTAAALAVSAIMALFPLVALPKPADAAINTNSPTSTTGGWSDPTFAYADGGNFANKESGTPSGSQTYGTYGFTTLTGKRISQVRVRYDAWGAAIPVKIRVQVSWDGGTSWSSLQTTSLTGSETTYWYDVTSATTWTPNKLSNSNFKVYVDAYTDGQSRTVNLDWIPVEVTYDDVNWASYQDLSHSTAQDTFSDFNTQHTVYMHGIGYAANTPYRIRFWNFSSGIWHDRQTEDNSSDGSGNLNGQHTFNPDTDVAGDWHCTVYVASSISSTYTSGDINLVADDTSYTGGYAFHVLESALPEFPTVFAAVGVTALCFATYYWMSRKRLAGVKS